MSLSTKEIEKRVDKSYELSNSVLFIIPKPMVTVQTSTYQHAPYIRECIEGVLMQKTTFPVEYIIGEDFSTDGTREIVFEYAEKYPNKIRVITADYNVGAKANGARCRKASRGKYMAICEGDDYWVDPLKLQKQVDFLEENLDCSLCFHASKNSFEHNPQKDFIHRPRHIPRDSKFEMKHVILGGGGFMATNSMVFLKKYTVDRPAWIDKAPVGDIPLMLLLALQGKIGYIDHVMSVYRRMTENSWSSTMQSQSEFKNHHYEILRMWDDFDEWTNYRYRSYVLRKKMKNRYILFKRDCKNFVKFLRTRLV